MPACRRRRPPVPDPSGTIGRKDLGARSAFTGADYASLMHLAGEFRLVELYVEPDDWLAERTLQETDLRHEGVLVLGVRRDGGHSIGAPHGRGAGARAT